MLKKNALIVSYSPLNTDPRVLRQIAALKDDFNIFTAGNSAVADNSIIFYQIYTAPPFSIVRKIKRLLQFTFKRFDAYYWDSGKKDVLAQLRKNKYDVVIANDIQSLPLALAIAGNTKLYFDAHEYHPREFEDILLWRLFDRKYVEFLCKKYIPKANAFSTVTESLAREYNSFLGIKPFVITNASDFQKITPSENQTETIRIIHHTAAMPSRKIELMIDMMNFLDDRFVFDLILVGNNSEYIKELEKRAEGNKQIRFIPPVPFKDISAFTNAYDIGLILWPPTNFNYLHGLPNKFFEFVQARLTLAVSPNPEMAELVKKYELGVVSSDYTPESMASAIKNLTKEKIRYHKLKSDLHAMELSSAENIRKIALVIKNLVQE